MRVVRGRMESGGEGAEMGAGAGVVSAAAAVGEGEGAVEMTARLWGVLCSLLYGRKRRGGGERV